VSAGGQLERPVDQVQEVAGDDELDGQAEEGDEVDGREQHGGPPSVVVDRHVEAAAVLDVETA
jgi:hypothetical protein